MNDERLFHKVVREDHKIFHVLVVPQTLVKYILHQAYDVLGDNGTAKTY